MQDNMRLLYSFVVIFLVSGSLMGQALHQRLSERTVAFGDTADVFIYVGDFDSIVSIQYSIRWDTAVARFAAWEETELPFLAIGASKADRGELRLSWWDSGGRGISLADSSTIAKLRFVGIGEPGFQTPVEISSNPLAIQVYQATSDPLINRPISLIPKMGRIQMAAPLGITLEVAPVGCVGEQKGQIALRMTADTANYRVAWRGPGDFSASGYQLNGLAAGNYQLSVTDLDENLIYQTDVLLEGSTSPLVYDIQLDSIECGATLAPKVQLSAAGGMAPYTYRLRDTESFDGIFRDIPAGTYQLQVVDALNCLLEDSIRIGTGDIGLDIGPPKQFLCPGDSVSLSVDLEAGQSALWSTGSTEASISVSATGTYSVAVTTSDGCTARDTVIVRDGGSVAVELLSDAFDICPGDSLQLVVAGAETYEWLNADTTISDPFVPNPLVYPSGNRLYTVVGSSNCGSDTLSIDVLVYDLLVVDAGRDTCIGPGTDYQLTASGGQSYRWLPNSFPVSDSTIANPVVNPTDSTTYFVEITDINGCTQLDSVTILTATDPASLIDAVNVLTPNGDRFNDVLEFEGMDKFGDNSLRIYNRWGNLIYEKANYQSDADRFDGSYKGQPLPAGNYFYVLAFESGEIKQTLLIIRE